MARDVGAISLRNLTAADAVAYREIRLAALRDAPTAFGSDYHENVDMPLSHFESRIGATNDHFIRVAEAHGGMVGTLGLRREDGTKRGHIALLWGMYVEPSARNRGIGGLLLTDVLTAARQLKGLEIIELSVVVGNESARRLYDAHGFVTYGVEPRALKIDGRYYDEAHMALEL